ncbi:hypothetical protein CAB88_29560 (plasmid) [Bacillus thuringiensis]|uniref:Uncharacterized protein n=2 Tax=Bacillus thuringiensis TaxID=1428 RepID=A0A1W6WX87_BACTU|nr:hypothetical protein CAB88_29560 [Bacillus thuringiensis]OTW41420.1 hypothetical protein BK698_11030 [Bacillus thuringiensis serovar thuringiensis]AST05172.1 hypothetical protein BT10792_32175 [Bacillus thuringiensis]MBN6705859.1 hypothetical protein [Bacillus thuringiensis]MDN7081949.1 hypothetical protein [Bacillus thuringiensis]
MLTYVFPPSCFYIPLLLNNFIHLSFIYFFALAVWRIYTVIVRLCALSKIKRKIFSFFAN